MKAIDPESGRAGIGGRVGIALLQVQLGEPLRRLERAGAKPLAWLDGPLGGTVLGQELTRIKLERLLKVQDGGVHTASKPSHPRGGQCPGKLDQVHLGVWLDHEPVGIALTHEER